MLPVSQPSAEEHTKNPSRKVTTCRCFTQRLSITNQVPFRYDGL